MKKTANNTYEILHQIGRGSYASVHKAINKRTGEICAIKKIPVASEFYNLKNEIGILSDCKCKNIVRYLDSACSGEEVSIVMEYCCGGSVKDVMRSLRRTMNQDQIIVIVRDVLNGLDYLHSKNKIHRDVKAANILLNSEGVAKLGDFGVSEPSDASVKKGRLVGTLLWLPPEVIRKDCNYKPVIDIWSLGITIIEMAENDPPYYNIEQDAALKEISDIDKPSPTFRDPNKWSQNFKDFLSLCLDKDSSRRKSANELLKYDIIKNCPSNEIIKSLVVEITSIRSKDEKNLYKKSKCLLIELGILTNIHNERLNKVIKVDHLADSIESLKREFTELLDKTNRKDAKVKELTNQLKSMVNEIIRLERDRTEFEANLKISKKRNQCLLNDLTLIGKKLKDLENEERLRRRKLSSLES